MPFFRCSKILVLKSSSEQIFPENCRWVPLNLSKGVESESHASRIVSAIKIYDTFERPAVKIHRRVFVSCSRAKGCNFSGLITFCSETFQLWRSMRKITSCKETRESPSCFSSLIGQKNIFLANQKQAIQRLLELVR